jgi:N-acetylneuraminic acid mutarotase
LGAGSEGKVQIYDPATNRWSLGADMPFAAGSSSSAVISGRVYVAGGIISSTSTPRAARYDPLKNTWTELPPMPAARNHAASGTDGRRLYIFGGRGPGSGDSNTVANGFDTVQIYDPVRNLWLSSGAATSSAGSSLRPLPQARGGTGKALFYRGNFYVMGGETVTGAGATPNHVYDRVDVYNPLANTWRLAAPMPTARHGVFPLLYGGRAYLAGGGIRSGSSTSAVLEVLNLQ